MNENHQQEAPQGQNDALLVHYWYILKKRKWVVFSFTAFLMLTVTIATMMATRYYASTAVVEISPKAPTIYEVDEVQDFVTAATGQELRNYYATQYKIIQSRSVMERAIELLREEHGVTDFDGKEKPVEFLSRHLVLEPIVETHLVRITFEYPDAEKAALFSNVLASAYMENNLERSLESSKEALGWLQEQMTVYRDRKYESDEAIHQFRSEHDLLGMDEKYNTSVEALETLQHSWSEASAERVQVEAVVTELVRLHSSTAWRTLAELLSAESPVLVSLNRQLEVLKDEQSTLGLQYQEAHPKMKGKSIEIGDKETQIKAQVNEIIRGKKANLEVVRSRETALKTELDSRKVEVKELGSKLIELEFMRSDATRNEAFFQSLDTRLSEVDLSQVLKANNIRIVDMALPGDDPVRPKLPVNLAMSLVLGILGGCGLAFLMEYLDGTVKTREDIEQVVGIPLLGVVPKVDQDDLKTLVREIDRSLYVHARPRSTVSECLRSIRTNVMFRTPQSDVRTVLITSAAPREGKSFTSCNLAAIIAMTGSRVLLVDADLRRPALHKRFDLDNDMGLCNLFGEDTTLEQVIQHTHIEGLDVLVAGPPPPNPGELLGSGRMKELVKSMRNYDFILIDSPPVNVVADPLVLSSVADGVMLVVEANRTSRNVVVQAESRLSEMKAKVLGAVVNKLNIRAAGYGYYYYDTYGYYYTEAEQIRPTNRAS